MPYTTVTVRTTNPATPILGVLGNVAEAYTLANNDLINSVYLCSRKSFNVTDADVVEVPALGSAPLAMKESTYGRATGANVSCLLIPGIGGWTAAPSKIQASLNALGLAKESTQLTQTSGATIATDVSNTGVPLLPKSAMVVNDGAQTILTTATRTLGPFDLNRISYEIFCSFQEATLGTTQKTISLTLTFTDSVSGQVVDNVTFDICPATNSGAAHQVIIQGPTQGDTVTIDMLNNDTVTVNTLFTMLQSSRIFTHDHKFRSLNVPTFTGISTGGNSPRGGLLSDTAPSVGASSTALRMLSCYNGQATLVANIAVAGQASYFLTNLNPFANNSGRAFGMVMNAPPTQMTFLLNLPRSQCVLNLQNNLGSAQVLNCEIFFQDN